MSLLGDDCVFYILNMCKWDWAVDSHDIVAAEQKQLRKGRKRKEEWTENHELQPIGSRFHVEPNDFLKLTQTDKKNNSGLKDADLIVKRIKMGFKELLWSQGHKLKIDPIITESWLQYYQPEDGRGHNAHNHNIAEYPIAIAMRLAFLGEAYYNDNKHYYYYYYYYYY